MSHAAPIPVFALYGETGSFPDLLHHEWISDRSAALDWRIKPHRHADLAQLLVIEKGGGTAQFDGAEHALQDGSFAFIPPRMVHGFWFKKGTIGSVLTFPTELMSPAGSNMPPLSRLLMGRVEPDMLVLIELISRAHASAGRHRMDRLRGLTQALLAHLAEQSPDPRSDIAANTRIDLLAKLVSEHMEDGWSVANYADALSVSPGHLSRICRSATGIGAQAFIEHLLMSEARRNLAFTQLSVGEIGYRVGFADPSYFSKRFRAHEGLSPRDYRAKFSQAADARAVHEHD